MRPMAWCRIGLLEEEPSLRGRAGRAGLRLEAGQQDCSRERGRREGQSAPREENQRREEDHDETYCDDNICRGWSLGRCRFGRSGRAAEDRHHRKPVGRADIDRSSLSPTASSTASTRSTPRAASTVSRSRSPNTTMPAARPEAADKFRQAVADGVDIVFQGASSAIAGQITEDVRKHNHPQSRQGDHVHQPRRRGDGADRREVPVLPLPLHHHARRCASMPSVKAMKEAGDLGTRVYAINQNYSWGQDMQAAVEAAADKGGYTVVDEVAARRQQDPGLRALRRARSRPPNPDTVFTGNWSNDLLLLMKAAGDAGLDVTFATAFLDQPGNIANAGETALGHYIANNYDNAASERRQFRRGLQDRRRAIIRSSSRGTRPSRWLQLARGARRRSTSTAATST